MVITETVKRLKITAVCLLTGFLAAAAPSDIARLSPVDLHGQLSVINGKLVDAHGIAPQLRGMSLFWSIWEGKKYYQPPVVNWLVKDLKISLIRVAMGIEPDGGYLKDSVEQEHLLIRTVDAAIENGIYVILDWHDHHANLNMARSRSFFSRMAKKYAGNPNVIYEIWNEPEKVSWPVVKAYAETIITDIRKYDKANVIVVGSPYWDQQVDLAAADPIKGFNHIAYLLLNGGWENQMVTEPLTTLK